MSELILTDAEKSAATWLELDDATVGQLVKHTAAQIKHMGDEQQRVWSVSAAFILVGLASDANAANLTMKMEGMTDNKQRNGDWEITVRKIAP